ncbi:MAG TPA: amidohydrolase family protein, partial [Polyangia bacterium]|nr:amidohydrolase family protein [Polyangia bacterium]
MSSDGLTFVDAHVHFWDNARMPYPWLAAVPQIAGAQTPVALAIEAGGQRPTEIVFVESAVEPLHALEEVRWVEALATHEPRVAISAVTISAIVAQVAVDRGAETEAALAALAGHALVRGVRHIIEQHPEPDYCLRPAFLAGVQRVGERGWTFDLCVRPAQLPACIALARACPGTTFVLDHAGKPDIRRGLREPWRAHIAELARLPNVVCKLSGLVTEADPTTWTPTVLRPYVEHLLSCFGPGRLLFGSDWPVVNLAAGYRRWLETALEFLRPLPAGERAAVL